MALGVDPKNDFAFKCVFGSERHTAILVDVLNAVLRPPVERRVVSVEILNPITEPVVLDEKLSILDVKARDQTGRQFNVEMQMVPHPSLPSRFLYYWAKLYASQLLAGDRYEQLQPVISICFLDGILFPQTDRYHLRFSLVDEALRVTFSDDLEVHLFQLPNFVKTADELADPLDAWLYFLNNASELDASHLPLSLQRPEIEEAVEVLEMLTQDEVQREHYEAREKARRDAASWHSTIARFKQEAERLKQEAERLKEEAERLKEEAATSRTEGRAQGELIGQIHAYERLLGQSPTPGDHLTAMSLDELKVLLDQLGSQLNDRGQS